MLSERFLFNFAFSALLTDWNCESRRSPSPTFNAAPVVEAIVAAARRGVKCALYLDLAFNDAVRWYFVCDAFD